MDSKFNIISKDKDSIKLEMINYDNTLLRPLAEEILKYYMVKKGYLILIKGERKWQNYHI